MKANLHKEMANPASCELNSLNLNIKFNFENKVAVTPKDESLNNEQTYYKTSNKSTKKLNLGLKLSKAIQLLSDNLLYISEIAYMIGFNDPKYFSKCFKKEFGITPKEFRQKKNNNILPENEFNFDKNFIEKANEKVLENLSLPSFGADELAYELNVSYSTLYRKMKNIVGVSPCDFIRKTRIRNAVTLLKQDSLSFSDIAFATGFCDSKYFCRCFKSEFGLVPSEYIESLKAG